MKRQTREVEGSEIKQKSGGRKENKQTRGKGKWNAYAGCFPY